MAECCRGLAPLSECECERDRVCDWQPIATAPRDGTQVMLYFPKRYRGKGGISNGSFVGGDWLDLRAMRDNDCTHWKPMPKPPIGHTAIYR